MSTKRVVAVVLAVVLAGGVAWRSLPASTSVGDDGILMVYDSTRGKLLSAGRWTWTFSDEATTGDNEWYHPAGFVAVTGFDEGPIIPRDATLTGVTFAIEFSATAPIGFEVLTVTPPSETPTVVYVVPDGDRIDGSSPAQTTTFSDLDLDLDVSAGDMLFVRQDSPSSGQSVSPVVVLEFAYR